MPKVLFGSYQPDIASVDTQNSSYVHNVIPNASGYGPIYDLLTFADPLPARNLGAIGVIDDDNTAHIFAGTSTKLYKLDSTTREWEDVTRASGGNYSVADRDYWSFALFGQNVVAVVNGNAPQVYTLGSSTDFAALGGSPPQARYVGVVGDFLVLIGLTSNPNRIQWSALNDITGWTPGTDSSDYQDFPDGGFTVGVASGEYGLVFQDTAIRRMVFNPVSGTIFDFDRISETRGLFMPYSLAKTNQASFFYSSDGFYRTDGSGAMVPIGENKVDATFAADCDFTNPRNLVGQADPQSGRVYWAYKSKGNPGSYLDKMLIYDWQRNQFTPATINLEYMCQTSPLGTTLESLDSLGTLDALPYSLDSYVSTPEMKLTGFGTDHAPGYFEGDALEATLDLPEGYAGDTFNTAVTQAVPLGDMASAYVKIGKRQALNDDVTYSSESAMNSRGVCPVRSSARFITGRLRIPAATDWTWVRGIEFDNKSMGLR